MTVQAKDPPVPIFTRHWMEITFVPKPAKLEGNLFICICKYILQTQEQDFSTAKYESALTYYKKDHIFRT